MVILTYCSYNIWYIYIYGTWNHHFYGKKWHIPMVKPPPLLMASIPRPGRCQLRDPGAAQLVTWATTPPGFGGPGGNVTVDPTIRIQWTMGELDNISHRIHGAGIYANIGGILMVSMLPYIAAPWILGDMVITMVIYSIYIYGWYAGEGHLCWTIIIWLVVSTYPSEKWWSSSMGRMTSHMLWKQSYSWLSLWLFIYGWYGYMITFMI